MTTIAIDFNDAALVAVGPDGVLGPEGCPEPGYATVTGGVSSFGLAAWHQARLRPRDTYDRFWCQLSTEPLSGTAGSYATSADLVHAHFQSLWAVWSSGVSEALFVVPAYWSQEQLGLLLGIAEELAIPAIGLVDSAVAATRSRVEADDLLTIDVSLHAAVIIWMKQDGGTSIDSRQSVDGIGLERLERTCVQYIAACFLERTRFDPLHDASSEQALYDGLHGWLRLLQRSASVAVTLDRNGDEYSVQIERDGLAAALTSACEPMMQHIRSRLTAGRRVAIQVTDRLARFPGIVDVLDRLPRVTTFVLEPAAAARGALSRAGQFARGNGGVALKTTLRWDRAAIEIADSTADAQPATSAEQPTHVLHAGCVYRIGRQPLSIGSELKSGEYGISLPARTHGLSRRHCSIQSGVDGIELVDHSRFGTRLNGHVIDKAAIMQVGDMVSVGEPSVDLQIVTEVTARETGQESGQKSDQGSGNGA